LHDWIWTCTIVSTAEREWICRNNSWVDIGFLGC
jgi:hypothetical protein